MIKTSIIDLFYWWSNKNTLSNEMSNEIFFETIKCYKADALHLKYHNARITRTIGININLYDFVHSPNNKLLKCKVLYNSDGILDISYEPYKKREPKSFKIIEDDTIEYKYKSINRTYINRLFEQRKNADEIIIVKNKLITDTSIANIAIFDGKKWLTPKTPLLLGTTRARLLEKQKIIEADIDTKQLLNAKKIALMNAMIDFDIIEDYTILNMNKKAV